MRIFNDVNTKNVSQIARARAVLFAQITRASPIPPEAILLDSLHKNSTSARFVLTVHVVGHLARQCYSVVSSLERQAQCYKKAGWHYEMKARGNRRRRRGGKMRNLDERAHGQDHGCSRLPNRQSFDICQIHAANLDDGFEKPVESDPPWVPWVSHRGQTRVPQSDTFRTARKRSQREPEHCRS